MPLSIFDWNTLCECSSETKGSVFTGCKTKSFAVKFKHLEEGIHRCLGTDFFWFFWNQNKGNVQIQIIENINEDCCLYLLSTCLLLSVSFFAADNQHVIRKKNPVKKLSCFGPAFQLPIKGFLKVHVDYRSSPIICSKFYKINRKTIGK